MRIRDYRHQLLPRSVDRFTFHPKDLSIVAPTPQAQERQRVATTTERLIRAQTNDLNEYHKVLEDANEIAEAIKDMPVESIKPRTTWTPPPPATDLHDQGDAGGR